jgi:hypothetical protein
LHTNAVPRSHLGKFKPVDRNGQMRIVAPDSASCDAADILDDAGEH